MLLMYLEVLGKGFFGFHGRNWEGVCGKAVPEVLDMKHRS